MCQVSSGKGSMRVLGFRKVWHSGEEQKGSLGRQGQTSLSPPSSHDMGKIWGSNGFCAPGGPVVHQGVGRPANPGFEAPQSGDLYSNTSSRFQMISSGPNLGVVSLFLAPPRPRLSSPTESCWFYVRNMHPGGSLCSTSHQHLARGSSSLPGQWGSFQAGLQRPQPPVSGHTFERPLEVLRSPCCYLFLVTALLSFLALTAVGHYLFPSAFVFTPVFPIPRSNQACFAHRRGSLNSGRL